MVSNSGRRAVGGLLLLGLFASGCATEVSLASAIDAGRANELAATAEYRAERLLIYGVVTQTGLKRVGGALGEYKPGYVTVSPTQTAYPYLYAQDPVRGQAGGRLLCFFEPSELRDVAAVGVGQRVEVTGNFQQYSDRGATLVLSGCKLP
jgi:hypothetical protein